MLNKSWEYYWLYMGLLNLIAAVCGTYISSHKKNFNIDNKKIILDWYNYIFIYFGGNIWLIIITRSIKNPTTIYTTTTTTDDRIINECIYKMTMKFQLIKYNKTFYCFNWIII